jgi:LysM repeat protein
MAEYEVKKGDTLFGIARAHGMTVSELQAANTLTTTTIMAGEKLKVKAAPATATPAAARATSPAGLADRLAEIATPRPVQPATQPAPTPVPARVAPPPKRVAPPPKRVATARPAPAPAPAPSAESGAEPGVQGAGRYHVQKGDTYYSISRALGCPVGELMALNSTQDLKYGTYIQVPMSVTNKALLAK